MKLIFVHPYQSDTVTLAVETIVGNQYSVSFCIVEHRGEYHPGAVIIVDDLLDLTLYDRVESACLKASLLNALEHWVDACLAAMRSEVYPDDDPASVEAADMLRMAAQIVLP